MADEKKDEYEFSAPDFDEHAFIHREMVSFRTTVILFVWGIVAALVSWGLFLAQPKLGWVLGLGVCAVFGFSLKFLYPRLGADIAHFKRREWMGTGFLFFFTWLSFFMLAINPPITDIAPPELFLDAMPVQQVGSNITFDALATDNAHLAAHTLKVERVGTGVVAATVVDLGGGHLRATVPAAPAGTYRATATASDGRNGDATLSNTTQVTNAVHLRLPPSGVLDETTFVSVTVDGQHACTADDVKVAAVCVRSVALKPTDGSAAIQLEAKDVGVWKAESTYKGWKAGNNTFTVAIEFQERFLGQQRVPGGSLILGAVSSVRVPDPAGTHEVVLTAQPPHRAIQIPGPELGLLAVAVLGAALLARRSKS